jgi:hypothetical protein
MAREREARQWVSQGRNTVLRRPSRAQGDFRAAQPTGARPGRPARGPGERRAAEATGRDERVNLGNLLGVEPHGDKDRGGHHAHHLTLGISPELVRDEDGILSARRLWCDLPIRSAEVGVA